jgi:hypothetical protein
MSFLKPYGTLAVGIALGMFVVPKVLRKANINVPSV